MAPPTEERKDRHSADPHSSVKGHMKKNGGGEGKFSVGSPDIQDGPAVFGKGDPNYDSDQDHQDELEEEEVAAPAAAVEEKETKPEVWDGTVTGKYQWNDASKKDADADQGELVTKYGWSDGKKLVSIYLELEGLDDVPVDKFEVSNEDRSVSLVIPPVGNHKRRRFVMKGLFEEISGVKLNKKEGKNTVVLKLQKKEESPWFNLQEKSAAGGGGDDEEEGGMGGMPGMGGMGGMPGMGGMGGMGGPMGGMGGMPNQMGMMNPQMMMSKGMMPPNMMGGMMPKGAGGMPGQMMPGKGMPGMSPQQAMMMQKGMMPGMMPGMMAGKGMPGVSPQQQQAMMMQKGMMGQKGGMPGGTGPQPGPQPMQQQQPQGQPPAGPGGQLNAAALAAAPPSVQKQMIGEKLFPAIARHQPEMAGKITGMMLEMDNSELLILLESDHQLKAKVDEALIVLQGNK